MFSVLFVDYSLYYRSSYISVFYQLTLLTAGVLINDKLCVCGGGGGGGYFTFIFFIFL